MPEGREQIKAFMEARFERPLEDRYEEGMARTELFGFNNWSALQSVGALEHFHCFVREATEDLL